MACDLDGHRVGGDPTTIATKLWIKNRRVAGVLRGDGQIRAGVAREVWEASGHHVRGAASSGVAAKNLEAGSGIGSRTIASLEYEWGEGREQLTFRDVLVLDEAGIVGSRQMDRVLAALSRPARRWFWWAIPSSCRLRRVP